MTFWKVACAAFLLGTTGAAEAAVKVFDFTGMISSSQDYAIVNGSVVGQIDQYAGTGFSGSVSYDTDAMPTFTSGFQELYSNTVTISFTSAGGSATGIGYINRFPSLGSLSFVAFTTGDYYLTQIGVNGPETAVGAPLPTDLSGQTFSFGAEGIVITGLDFRRSLGGTLTFNAAPAVPEPASWALLVAGFGMIGGAMRRRERVQVRFA